MDNNRILEALKMQPLSEEEKASRHILGRLYGPIATSKESTRNGRKYNGQLWRNSLSDEIFKEKVANKSLFLELGHPADREETDMTKVCACIPELPKIIDGDLYAYVDILDTPNGRLLKTLCDYGFTPGISSRGSGDLMANDEVDPDTFYLETWDIVQLPAVKKARLTVCESVDEKSLQMKKALTESFDRANDEDKKIMKESLDNLNIKIDEAEHRESCPIDYTEDCKEDCGKDCPIDYEEDEEVVLNEKVEEENVDEIAEDEPIEEPIEEISEEDSEKVEEIPEEETSEEKSDCTVGEMIKALSDYDKDHDVEFKPIMIDGVEHPIEDITFDEKEDKVLIDIKLAQPEANEENELPEDENPEVNIDITDSNEEEIPEVVENPESAEDNGDDEIIESLKEMTQQKDLLEKELKDLKESRTVSDAEVRKLNEELGKYKEAFFRISELASNARKFEQEAKSLKEQLNCRDDEISTLKSKVNYSNQLTESMNENARKVERLTEKLNSVEKELSNKNDELNATATKMNENMNLAKNYKAKFTAVLNKYVESKANMLGVRPSDIVSKLGESYTLSDIDKVCDNMLNESVGNFRQPLPFASRRTTVKPTASASVETLKNGYDIDDSLLELAGLK